jgi:hypothetical protein
LKKYSQFVSEKYSETEHGTLGEYIEEIAIEDEQVRNIVSQMTSTIDPQIRLSNAINLLDDFTKIELLKRVENHLENKEGETKVSTIVDFSEVPTIKEAFGQNILTTFFKCLTALGFKDNQQEMKEVPSEFLIFFKFIIQDTQKLKDVFGRFKSLKSVEIDTGSIHTGLYFGIKLDGNFEYGYYHDQLIPIGYFKLTKSIYNQLKLSELKSTSGFKKATASLSFDEIRLLSQIKSEMLKFNPGYFQQTMMPQLVDKTLTFGYLGLGKWDNGQLDPGEIENVKQNLKNYLLKYKWSEKVLVAAKPQNLWVLIQIKLK